MGIIKIFKRFLSLLDVKDDTFVGKDKFVPTVNEALNQLELLPNEAGQSFVDVNQVGLGLLVAVNQPISLVGNSYVLANATDETKVAIGIVVEVVDDDNIRYQKGGEYFYSGGGLTKGDAYYLDTSDGLVTNTEPSNYKQVLFEAIEVDTILINIEPMFVLDDSSGEGSGTTIIKVNQIGIGLLVAVDQPISLVGNSYVLANATDSSKIAIGIVTKVVDDDNIEYQDSGEHETVASYTKGTAYYLDTSDGVVVDTEPTNYKQILFTAIETNKILIDVGNMYVLDADGSTGSAEIIIAVSQVGLGLLASLDDALALVSSNYVLANATDETKVAIGIVTKIVDDDNIEYKDTGTYETANSYTEGSSYYLHIVDGESTDTEPDNFKQSIFRAIGVNKILINIENMFVLSDEGSPYITEAPDDGKQYGRESKSWTEIIPGGATPNLQQVTDKGSETDKDIKALSYSFQNNLNKILSDGAKNLILESDFNLKLRTKENKSQIVVWENQVVIVSAASNIHAIVFGTQLLTQQRGASFWDKSGNIAMDLVPITKSADYTLLAQDDIVLVNSSSGDVIITLPTADQIGGQQYTIKKTASSNTVTIDGDGTETIDLSLTKVLTTLDDFITIVSDGANWKIVGGIITLPSSGGGVTVVDVTLNMNSGTLDLNSVGIDYTKPFTLMVEMDGQGSVAQEMLLTVTDNISGKQHDYSYYFHNTQGSPPMGAYSLTVSNVFLAAENIVQLTTQNLINPISRARIIQ